MKTGFSDKRLIMTMFHEAVTLASFMVLLGACGSPTSPANQETPRVTPDLVKVNRYIVKKDQATIKNLIAREGWQMTPTQTGLWYMIINHGNGKKAEKGDVISLKYRISLPDGNTVYSSDSLGLKTFRIGQGNVESGLEEGVLLLHQGDQAKFIMPPYLAYGLIGDSKKIPGRAIIVYDVEIVSLKPE